MPLSLGDLCLQASAILDDPNQARFPLVQLRRWCNEGQREVSRRSECLRATTTLSFNAGDQSNDLTSSVIRVSEVEWQTTGDTQWYPLQFRDHRAARPIWGTHQEITQGIPELYWTQGYPGSTTFTLHLFPTPASAGTARIHYYRYSTDLSITGSADATAIDLPAGWEDCCLPWICYRAMQSARESARAGEFKAEFDERVGMLIEASVRYVDEPGSMVMDDWYDIFDDMF
jgi:hypothetical protein